MMPILDLAEVPESHAPIYRLEAKLLTLAQVEMPVEHDHCSGLYARTMHIPAGTVLTGAVHKEACFFVVRTGTIAVTTDNGVTKAHAGDMLLSKAGTKRAGVAITDVVITTFHANPTNETDPAALWDLFTVAPPAIAGHSLEKLE
jgi:quercetin dioxygenase-like cupin family protein